MALAHRPVTAEGIYGCLAVAVVCTAWSGDNLAILAAEVAIYSVTLWLFHVYARVAQGGWSSRTRSSLMYWARHEWPHLEAAAPALVVIALGWLLTLGPKLVSDVALIVTLGNLIVWQLALLVPRRSSIPSLVAALVLDVAIITALVLLRLWIK
jgi:hypothetical protein